MMAHYTEMSCHSGSESNENDSMLPSSFDYKHPSVEEKNLLVLGISPGNSYFAKKENLLNLIKFASKQSIYVKIFIPDVIAVHNYQAIGSTNPERSSRVKCKLLRNRCKSLLKDYPALTSSEFTFVDWRKKVETSSEYTQKLEYMMKLFQTNQQFHKEALEITDSALKSLWQWKINVTNQTRLEAATTVNDDHDREPNQVVHSSNPKMNRMVGSIGNDIDGRDYDLFEGVNYILKEFAFFLSIPKIYDGFNKYAILYHKPWPILENLFKGAYDKRSQSCVEYMSMDSC